MTSLEKLQLFNEKAETLRQYKRFMESIKNRKLEFKHTSNPDDGLTYYGPDQELMSACILTIRLFCQNNDGISFQEMKKLYDELSISQRSKDEFNQVKNALNRYLDDFSRIVVWGFSKDEYLGMGIIANTKSNLDAFPLTNMPYKETLINRFIFDNMIYGYFAHSNKLKRQEIQKMMSNEEFAKCTWFEFAEIIIQFMGYIFAVEDINKKVISEIEQLES
ncbi:MAG: hypothetical protein RLZZ507_4067 [Cyanobacteriota bacterium]|jgi:hypothetical protein